MNRKTGNDLFIVDNSDEELKAQEKAAKAAGKVSSSNSPMAMSLFDPDDDLDAMAAAAGEPPRPKFRATPANAAGGNASNRSAKAEDTTDWQAMCALRAVLARNSALTRVELVREAARELGFARTGARINQNLDYAIRRAVRRAIAVCTRGTLTLGTRGIADYDRAFLKRHLLSVIGSAWCDKADIPVRFARMLGFARTGAKIEDAVWAMMKGLQRAGLVEVEGRGATACYRKTRASRLE